MCFHLESDFNLISGDRWSMNCITELVSPCDKSAGILSPYLSSRPCLRASLYFLGFFRHRRLLAEESKSVSYWCQHIQHLGNRFTCLVIEIGVLTPIALITYDTAGFLGLLIELNLTLVLQNNMLLKARRLLCLIPCFILNT